MSLVARALSQYAEWGAQRIAVGFLRSALWSHRAGIEAMLKNALVFRTAPACSDAARRRRCAPADLRPFLIVGALSGSRRRGPHGKVSEMAEPGRTP